MLHQFEKAVLRALGEGAATPEELSKATNLPNNSIVRALFWLKEKNAVEIIGDKHVEYRLSDEGKHFCEIGFPERRLLEKVASGEVLLTGLAPDEKAVGIPWAKRLGWIVIAQKGSTVFVGISPAGKDVLGKGYGLEQACRKVLAGAKVTLAEMQAVEKDLLSRRLVVKHEKFEITQVKLTKQGEALMNAEAMVPQKTEVNVLTKEFITSGKWKGIALRPYDTKAPVEESFPGKKHPLRLVMNKIRRIFLEMGFEEMEGGIVQSSFWNFDALFQPQDHPARELADTFYLMKPDKMEIPDEELAKKVGKAHQKGWGYSWSREVAEQPVLRTHTTALSARYVAETGMDRRPSPAKYFAIGRVYRNEATDYKHLAEFHQVEGIIVDENANFRDLLGLLKEFYRKLGFEKIRFRPSFFPYTEPSLEIEVFYEPKGIWMELGGAGMLRPEVCLPLWGKYPVLAWGLSLERPIMMMRGIEDIRTFYKNDMSWLRKSRISEAL